MPTPGSRLLRLLAVLTWLARQGRAPVSELSERFGLEPDELIADLELAACCGLPPYSPDQLMEIIVDDQEVIADLGAELGRSRRLTAAEGFALAASARAILAVPGADPDGALGRAVAKLEAVLGGRGLLRVDLREPAHLAVIRDATEARRQLELRYYSASRTASRRGSSTRSRCGCSRATGTSTATATTPKGCAASGWTASPKRA